METTTFQRNQRFFVVGLREDKEVFYAVMDNKDQSIVTEWISTQDNVTVYDLMRRKAWSLEDEFNDLALPDDFDPTAKFVKDRMIAPSGQEYAVFVVDRDQLRSRLKVVTGGLK